MFLKKSNSQPPLIFFIAKKQKKQEPDLPWEKRTFSCLKKNHKKKQKFSRKTSSRFFKNVKKSSLKFFWTFLIKKTRTGFAMGKTYFVMF